MMNPESVDERGSIAEQAAAWRVSLAGHDSRRVPEFWQWVTRSPEHVREALLMGLLNEALQDVDPEGRIALDAAPPSRGLSLISASNDVSSRPERTGRFNRWMVASIAMAACALLCLAVFLFRGTRHNASHVKTYVTDTGEQRWLTLADGSTVVLDAQSRLQVELSDDERTFHLLQGQALFSVARDPRRPFRVRAAATTIEALGTEFNVRTEETTTVAVLDGAVSLYSESSKAPPSGTASASSTRLSAGEGASVDGNGAITGRTKVDRSVVTAWKEHRLVFLRVPLEDIVREFNRYNRKGRLYVEGHAGVLRYGGVFDATDPKPLLLLLEKNPAIQIDHRGEDLVIRDKP